MSNDTQLTITGNLVDDPPPRHTPNGQPAVRFRIASTPRFYDKAGESAAARPGRAAGRRVGRTSPPLISRKYVDPDLLHPAMTSSGQRRSPAPALAAIPTVPPERAAARLGSTVRRLPSRRPDQPVRSG